MVKAVEENGELWPEMIKASYNNLDDFKTSITGTLRNDMKKMLESGCISEEEFKGGINSIIRDVESNFQKGDEIIHYSDYDVFRKMGSRGCGRESILIKRGSIAKEVHLIKRS